MVKVKIVYTNKNIQEGRQRLGYVSPCLVKKTFDNSTQDYPGVRNEREVMPKKSSVVRFPSLSDPMPGIFFVIRKKFPWDCWIIPTRGKSLGPCILGRKA